MKGKFKKILGVGLAVALVLSFSLVAAVPASANDEEPSYAGYMLEDWTSGTAGVDSAATWSTTNVKPGFGSYSAELYAKDSADDMAAVKVPYGQALDTINNADFTYNYYTDTFGGLYGVLYIDKDGGSVVDRVLVSNVAATRVTGAWTETAQWSPSGQVDGWWTEVGYDPATGDFISPPAHGATWQDLEDWKAKYPNATLIYAGAAWGFANTSASVYIDDVCIDGVTHYDLEPIVLEKDYYRTGESIKVTVPNGFANTDPIRVNPLSAQVGDENWVVHVTSDSDAAGITVDLQETLMNSGVFWATFVTTDQLPAPEDEVYGASGDTITVEYNGDWGAGAQMVTAEATVDDTAPVVEITAPEDGALVRATVEITADITEAHEGTVVVNIDGEPVATTLAYSWNTAALVGEDGIPVWPDGWHDIEVVATDLAGNVGSDFISVDVENTPPELIWIMWDDVDSSADISQGDRLGFGFSEAIDPESIPYGEVDDRLPTSDKHTYGVLAEADLFWPEEHILVVTLGAFTNIEPNETVNPSNDVTDLAGNPDDTPELGPAIVQVTVWLEVAEKVAVPGEPYTVFPGEAFTVTVNITDITDFDSAQFDVVFSPDILKLTSVTNGLINATTIPVDYWQVDPGRVRVIGGLPFGEPAVSGFGTLAELNFTFIGPSGEGSGIGLENGMLSDKNANEIYANWFGTGVHAEYVKGDANGDGEVNILDLTYIKNHIFNEEDFPGTPGCDANQDKEVNVLDITYVKLIILELVP